MPASLPHVPTVRSPGGHPQTILSLESFARAGVVENDRLPRDRVRIVDFVIHRLVDEVAVGVLDPPDLGLWLVPRPEPQPREKFAGRRAPDAGDRSIRR